MPTLINDWDNAKRQPTSFYAVKCSFCGQIEKQVTPALPKGWEEDQSPNADGRTLARCPDCRS